jgi:hypothetical protein
LTKHETDRDAATTADPRAYVTATVLNLTIGTFGKSGAGGVTGITDNLVCV